MIKFARPNYTEGDLEAMNAVMRSEWVTNGEQCAAFEEEFSNFISPPGEHYYCIFTNSCTSALKMAYKWMAEQHSKVYGTPGYMVYPDNTFCATYSAAAEMGLIVKKSSEVVLYPNDKRVVMHYGGIKDTHECLIEDSAHRIEQSDPLVGKIRCYSFYVTKNMTTNRGGMFVTADKEIYEQARIWWKDGLTTTTAERLAGLTDYHVAAMAGGYDADDVYAALGRSQLQRLPAFNARRQEIRERYNAAFDTGWLGTHLYCVDLGSEERVTECRKYLLAEGIGSGYHYPDTGWTSVSLPIYPDLTLEEQDLVIAAMKKGGYA